MRSVWLSALLVGCASPTTGSVAIEWVVFQGSAPVDCPGGSEVEVVVGGAWEVFPCDSYRATIDPVAPGQHRAELRLLDAGGDVLASQSRLTVVEAGEEAMIDATLVLD